jgi:hypothetical protein
VQISIDFTWTVEDQLGMGPLTPSHHATDHEQQHPHKREEEYKYDAVAQQLVNS